MSSSYTTVRMDADDQISFELDTEFAFGPLPTLFLGYDTSIQWSSRQVDQAIGQLHEIALKATELRNRLVQYVEEKQPGRAAYDAERASMNGTAAGTAGGVDDGGPVSGPGNPEETTGPPSPSSDTAGVLPSPAVSEDRPAQEPGPSSPSDGGAGSPPDLTAPDAAVVTPAPSSPREGTWIGAVCEHCKESIRLYDNSLFWDDMGSRGTWCPDGTERDHKPLPGSIGADLDEETVTGAPS